MFFAAPLIVGISAILPLDANSCIGSRLLLWGVLVATFERESLLWEREQRFGKGGRGLRGRPPWCRLHVFHLPLRATGSAVGPLQVRVPFGEPVRRSEASLQDSFQPPL